MKINIEFDSSSQDDLIKLRRLADALSPKQKTEENLFEQLLSSKRPEKKEIEKPKLTPREVSDAQRSLIEQARSTKVMAVPVSLAPQSHTAPRLVHSLTG